MNDDHGEASIMSVRTSETTVTFKHPFMLAAFDGPQPAGTYRLVTDEQEIPGLSFSAFQRTATMLHLPALAMSGRSTEVFLVDPADLIAALEADEHT
jgi:hypothetical protein